MMRHDLNYIIIYYSIILFSRDSIIMTRRVCTKYVQVICNKEHHLSMSNQTALFFSNLRARAYRLVIIERVLTKKNFVQPRERERGPRGHSRSPRRFYSGSLCNFPTKLFLSPQITAAILVEPRSRLVRHSICISRVLFRDLYSAGHNASEEYRES